MQVLDGGQPHTVDPDSTSPHFHGSKHNIPGECGSYPAHQTAQCISQPSTSEYAEGRAGHPYPGATVWNTPHPHSVPPRTWTAWGEDLPGFLCCGCLATG